ncbi:hypothetical protein NL676_022468 [Syzygium grande]|nr:hypothetical protein NL676_022468 [Syzygium grande]
MLTSSAAAASPPSKMAATTPAAAMAAMARASPLTSVSVAASLDRRRGFRFAFPRYRPALGGAGSYSAATYGGPSWYRPPRVSCQSKTDEKQMRRYSPILEGALLSSGDGLASDEWTAVPDIWRFSAEKYGERIALVDPYHDPPSNITYNQLEQEILNFSEGLRVIGVKPDEKLALYADNSCRWLIADQGIMATGAINVVRGSRSSVEELLQIYQHSESVALAVDSPELYNRIAEVFCDKASMRFGNPNDYEIISSDDVATLMYTSGTTGNPKGVMLTHRNFLHQIKNLWDIVPAVPGDRFLSILPPWHAYERACEYFIFTHGVEQVYTTVRCLKEDLQQYQPHYLISVPLVYETLYSGIQKQLSTGSAARKLIALSFIRISMAFMDFKRIYEGKYLTRDQKEPLYLVSMLDCLLARIFAAILWPLHMLARKIVYSKIHSAIGISKAGISGGGSLPTFIDKFFEAIGVTVQNGYGLTECSPVTAARRPTCNVLGSIGHPIRYTEFKIVHPETDEVLPPGTKGIVKVRGPQVMNGYYKNPSATSQVLDASGWFNSGDIGWMAPHHSSGRSRNSGGVIVLEGRAKDTIVLSTGENVEPAELEEAAMRSSLIQQIVVIGQDQRRLGAIIVPNKEEALLAAKRMSIVDANAVELSKEKMSSLLYEELRTWTSKCTFQIGPMLIVDEPFTIDGGLMTPTMKIRRDRVVDLYKDQISKLYS